MKILIIKVAAIGDVILSLPMLQALRTQHPQAEITWVVDRSIAPILKKADPTLHILPLNLDQLLRGNPFAKMLQVFSIWKHVAFRKFDLILTAQNNPLFHLFSLLSWRKEHRYFYRFARRIYPIPGRPYADEYLRLFHNFDGPGGIEHEYPDLSVPLPKAIRTKLDEIQGKKIVLCPGGLHDPEDGRSLRSWPHESFQALSKLLIYRGLSVVLSNGPEHKYLGRFFDGVTDLIGRTSLLESISLYRECDLVITQDGGPVHLGRLSGTPVLSLYGPVTPREIAKNEHVIWGGADLPCRPCTVGVTYPPCKNNLCVRSITPEQVFEKACEILGIELE